MFIRLRIGSYDWSIIMSFKKYIGLLSAVLCISVITFNVIENTYAGLFSKKSTKKESVYKSYVDEISKIAAKTNLVDFSWMDIEKINGNDFNFICDELKSIAKKNKGLITVLIRPEDATTKLKGRTRDNFQTLYELVNNSSKLDLPDKERVPGKIAAASSNVLETVKTAFTSAKKSKVFNLMSITDALSQSDINVISACIARLRVQLGPDVKLKFIYNESVKKYLEQSIKTAKVCDFKIYCIEKEIYGKDIQAAINMSYETHAIDLLNICENADNLGDSELQIVLGGITEFADRYEFDGKPVDILIGWKFDKFFNEIKELCDKYNGKFNLIREVKYLTKSGDKYSLDYSNQTAVSTYLDKVSSRHTAVVGYLGKLAEVAQVIDSASIFMDNYNEGEMQGVLGALITLKEQVKSPIYIEYVSPIGGPAIPFHGPIFVKAVLNCNREIGAGKDDKQIGVISDYRQALAKKLNTAYYTNQFVINPEKHYFTSKTQLNYEPAISVASKIFQRSLMGKSVKDLKVYGEFGNSVEDKKAKELLDRLNVKIKAFDVETYKHVMKVIENAEVTGVLDFADNKFNDIEENGNFDMAIACIVNFLQDNLSRDIKFVVGNKTKSEIVDKISALKKAYSKLNVEKMEK